MKNSLRLLLLTIITVLVSMQTSLSQDSTNYVQYDIIYLKDGRILKGEILSYDSQFGGISFKDPFGRMYNFGRDEYKYFKENQNFPVKNKDKTIRPRKDKGFGFNAGVSVSYINMNLEVEEDDYYISNNYGNADIPISLYAAAGKYFSRQHYLGLAVDFGLTGDEPGYYAAGLRYCYQYDAHKTNTALYFPIELKYQHVNMVSNFTVRDTTWYSESSYSYPGYLDPVASFDNLALSIGHGFGFVLKNSHSFNIELSYMKSFILSTKYTDLKGAPHEPNSTHKMGAFRLGLFYSF